MGEAAGGRVGICQGSRKRTQIPAVNAIAPGGKPARALFAFGFLDDPFEPGNVGNPEVTALAPQ